MLKKKINQQQGNLNKETTLNSFASDETFNALYPEAIRVVANRHWTPVDIAVKSAAFLNTHAGARILDIGSGAGKFCLVAAKHFPNLSFTGIEQRKNLVELSESLRKKAGIGNVEFIHGNIESFDISRFDHFYFYNSFYENLPGTQKIDLDVVYSEKLYDFYNLVLYKKLNKMKQGTRLVTYHSLGREVPPGFEVVNADYADFLKFWIKV